MEMCGLCGKDERSHMSLNHEYSITGQLIPRSQNQPEAPQKVTVNMMSSSDVALRSLLVQKGLVTAEEIFTKEAEIRERLARGPQVAANPSNTDGAQKDHTGAYAI